MNYCLETLNRMERQPHIILSEFACYFHHHSVLLILLESGQEPAHAILHSWMWFLNMRLSAKQGIIR